MRSRFFTLRKVVTDVNTENDGKSWDAVRLAGSYLLLPGIPVFFWGVVYDSLQQHRFNYSGFAWGMGGIGAVILQLAGGINLKTRTDGMGPPQPPSPPPPSGEQQ